MSCQMKELTNERSELVDCVEVIVVTDYASFLPSLSVLIIISTSVDPILN